MLMLISSLCPARADPWQGYLPPEHTGNVHFRLKDQNGKKFTEQDLKGSATLLVFGYTFCPDICPTSLMWARVVADKSPQPLRVVFVTLDPKRDTPTVLKAYLSAFGPNIIGLSGTEPQIKTLASAYRVNFQVARLKSGGYAIDHSAYFYLLDHSGRLALMYKHDTPIEDILVDLGAKEFSSTANK